MYFLNCSYIITYSLVLLLTFIVVQGISFSDLMYVTKRNMVNVVSSMTKHLEQVQSSLAVSVWSLFICASNLPLVFELISLVFDSYNMCVSATYFCCYCWDLFNLCILPYCRLLKGIWHNTLKSWMINWISKRLYPDK
jgi:hypothetical protein